MLIGTKDAKWLIIAANIDPIPSSKAKKSSTFLEQKNKASSPSSQKRIWWLMPTAKTNNEWIAHLYTSGWSFRTRWSLLYILSESFLIHVQLVTTVLISIHLSTRFHVINISVRCQLLKTRKQMEMGQRFVLFILHDLKK